MSLSMDWRRCANSPPVASASSQRRARSGLGIRSPTSTRPTSAAEYVIAWPN